MTSFHRDDLTATAASNELHAHWDTLWSRQSSHLRLLANRVGTNACWRIYARLIEGNPPRESFARVLELGAGSGEMSRRICQQFGTPTCTLVDYSRMALEFAKTAFVGLSYVKLRLLEADVTRIRLGSEYDLVHSAGLIEHFGKGSREQLDLVRRHAAACRRGGRVLIMVPAPVAWYKAARKIMELTERWPRDFEAPLTLANLSNVCSEAGLRVLAGVRSGGAARAAAVICEPVEE